MNEMEQNVIIRLTEGDRQNLLQFLNTVTLNESRKNGINECIAFADLIVKIKNGVVEDNISTRPEKPIAPSNNNVK